MQFVKQGKTFPLSLKKALNITKQDQNIRDYKAMI